MGLSGSSKRVLLWRARGALRAAERAVLAAAAFGFASLVVALAVLVFGPRLLLDGPPAVGVASAEGAAGHDGPARDSGREPLRDPARAPAPGAAAAVREPAAPDAGVPSPEEVLCAPAEDLVYAWTGEAGVVADGSGHFALYGAPDPETGEPTRDSYDLLRGCARDGSFANVAGVAVGTGGDAFGEPAPMRVLAEGAASIRTFKTQAGALVTVYELPEGPTVSQELSLVPAGGAGGGGDALEIRYGVENASGETVRVSLASLLAPALFVGPPGAANGSPFVSGTLARAGSDPAIRTERDLTLRAGEVGPLEVPRPGVASDSSGLWSPSSSGDAPDAVSLAGWKKLRSDPLGHEARPDRTLPAAASIAARWEERPVAPGETLSFSQLYGFPPHR